MQSKPSADSFTQTAEYINDSGAGRTIWSVRALRDMGFPTKAINLCRGPASQKITFDTGGGPKVSNYTLVQKPWPLIIRGR